MEKPNEDQTTASIQIALQRWIVAEGQRLGYSEEFIKSKEIQTVIILAAAAVRGIIHAAYFLFEK